MQKILNTILFILSFEFIISSPAFGQQAELNKPAPPIIVNNWVENPHYPWTQLEKKPIILKFWFTKCGPCVYSIPHLNDLSKKFKSDIAFVSVSFEKPSIIRSFLEEKEFITMTGSDTSQNNHKCVWSERIPDGISD